MDNGKAKEWSGAILYLIAKESGLFKMSEVRKNDESTFMLYNKALYYHICNDEVNANLYIQKAFEKNNIVPKYILGIEDKSFEEENVTDFMINDAIDRLRFLEIDCIAYYRLHAEVALIDPYIALSQNRKILVAYIQTVFDSWSEEIRTSLKKSEMASILKEGSK